MTFNYNRIVTFLQNPFVIIGSAILGLLVGFYDEELSRAMEPFGNAFMSLLEMSLIPIIICAIVLSISSLITSKNNGITIPYIVSILTVVMLATAVISTLFAIITDPAQDFLNSSSLKIKEISSVSAFTDRNTTEPIVKQQLQGFPEFIEESIPRNIFKAFSDTRMLQVIIFSIIFGIAVAFVQKSQLGKVQNFFETTLKIFKSIINAVTVWLPIGIFTLMAGSASKIGLDMMVQMASFIMKVYLMFLIIFAISTYLIAKKTGQGFFQVIRNLKDPILIAFGTRSAILPIPSILEAFENKFKFKTTVPELLVPLGAVLGRFGNISYFAFLSVFIVGVYQHDLTFAVFVVIIILTILGGMSTAGATGILTLISLTIIMDPLHIPVGALMPLLIAIDAIIDPMRTLVTVYTNCSAVALLSSLDENHDSGDSDSVESEKDILLENDKGSTAQQKP